MSGKRFVNKGIVVTGGASGIGRATVERFLEEGARVVFIDLSEKNGKNAVRDLRKRGYDSVFLNADVTKSSEVNAAIRQAHSTLGSIDVLFNNAGTLGEGTILDISEEEWNRTMEINVKSVFLVSKAVIPIMLRQRNGVIVNNASCSGLVGDRAAVAYNASKGAVVLLTRCLALDYCRKNIRVNCVCPGEIETPMFFREARAKGLPVKEFRRALSEEHPIGRIGRPVEVANAVLFLASDEASFITGTAFSVDGGYTCQ